MSLPRSNWADCQPMSPALGVSCSAPERAEASEGLEGSPMLAATKPEGFSEKCFVQELWKVIAAHMKSSLHFDKKYHHGMQII